MTEIDVVVIGAGLVGAALAFDLRKAGYRVVVLERESEVAAGASRSNSGVLHTGFDSTPGTFETQMILSQATRWREIFQMLGIPYREVGALLLAHTQDEAKQLPTIQKNASQNGVQTRLLNETEVRLAEPRSHAIAGLLVPGESITDPYEVVSRLLHDQEVKLDWLVEEVLETTDGVLVRGPKGVVAAQFAVNCAGLFADELGDPDLRITPRRGEFVVFGPGSEQLVNHILLPVPTPFTKGVLIFPTLYGHLCAGPSAVDQDDKFDWNPHTDELSVVRQKAALVLPVLNGQPVVDAWAGLRTVGHPHNYFCQFSKHVPGLLHLAGIRSTGLSACLGLSAWAVQELQEHGLSPRGPIELRRLESGSGQPWWQRLNRLRRVKPDVPRD